MSDLISRQAVIDRINKQREHLRPYLSPQDKIGDATYRICAEFIERIPSAQLDRDIPVKPKEITEGVWGFPSRQAVCPKCDYYLGHVAFIGEGKGNRITFCEICGQAIDWKE